MAAEEIEQIEGLSCAPPSMALRYNYAYFPILVGASYPLSRDELYEKLKQGGIYGRRYFYPLITEFPMYRQLPSAAPEGLPVAHRIASQVICLPIFPALRTGDLARILGILSN